MAQQPKKTAPRKTSVPKKMIEKRTTTRKAAASSAVKAAPKPVVVTETTATGGGQELRKKELIDTVTERSGVKRREVKPVVEAMLAVLGQALADSREMNLQPLGKVKINRRKDLQSGTVLIAKVRQSEKKPEDQDPLAEAAE